MLSQFFSSVRGCLRGPLTHLIWTLCAFAALPRTVAADPTALEGLHLVVMPSMAASHEGQWDTLAAADVGIVRVDEGSPMAFLGASLRMGAFATERHLRGAAQLWFGTSSGLGLSAGPTIDFQAPEPAKMGFEATLWYFAGIMPYVGLGAVDSLGQRVEVGLRAPLPAWRW